MQVKSIAEGEHSALLSTFIELPFAIKLFVLSIFEWPFYSGILYVGYYKDFTLTINVKNFVFQPIKCRHI